MSVKVMSPHALKTLQARINELSRQREDYIKMQKDAMDGIRKTNELIDKINSEIKKSSTTLKISEHAILRWIERANGFDLKVIQEEIMAFFGINPEAFTDNRDIAYGRFVAKIRGGVITTIVDKNGD